MKTLKKSTAVIALLLSMLCVFTFSACTINNSNEGTIKTGFSDFIDNEFVSIMEGDYLTAHIFLENPENFGVNMSKIIPQISGTDNGSSFEKSLANLKKYSYSVLTDSEKDTYDAYKFLLEVSVAQSNKKFDGYNNMFESMTGIHAQIPNLLADYVLRNEADVKSYISVVNSVLPFMDNVIAYTKAQAEYGTLMIDLDSVRNYASNIYHNGTNSATLSAMKRNIDSVEMPYTLIEKYKQQIELAFLNSYLPAYENIMNAMHSLIGAKNNTMGYSHLPNGKAYYEVLFKSKTGTSKSIADSKKMLNETLDKNLAKIMQIAQSYPDIYENWMYGNYATGYEDFYTILMDLEHFSKINFPAITSVDYVIEPLHPELTNPGISAYFNLPAIDGTTPKQIRVNTTSSSESIDSLSTFKTVAHEGFPGHLYQNAYSYENLDNNLIKVMTNSGYTEGFATYVEMFALNYLGRFDKTVAALDTASTIVTNCVVALIDIGIHYEGWNTTQTSAFVTSKGLNGAEISELYSQIQQNPGAFLSYYVGYAEFEQLRNYAEKQLGSYFNEIDFHTALLKSGSVNFAVVERNVKNYVNSKKTGVLSTSVNSGANMNISAANNVTDRDFIAA